MPLLSPAPVERPTLERVARPSPAVPATRTRRPRGPMVGAFLLTVAAGAVILWNAFGSDAPTETLARSGELSAIAGRTSTSILGDGPGTDAFPTTMTGGPSPSGDLDTNPAPESRDPTDGAPSPTGAAEAADAGPEPPAADAGEESAPSTPVPAGRSEPPADVAGLGSGAGVDPSRPTASTRSATTVSSSAPDEGGIDPTVASPPTVGPTTPAATGAPGPSTTAASAPGPSPTTTTATDTGGSGRLLWEENFDRLDSSRWAVEHSTYGDGNDELQCYRPRNVSVAGGVLRLRAVTETYTCPNGSTRSVTSGMVRSRGVTFSPGQALEFRVRLTPADPADQGGLWPAVWSSGWAGGGWPRAGELDFLEVMTAKSPNRSVYSMHYARPDGSHGVTNREVYGNEPFSARWHVVRFEYGIGGRLVWYLDGKRVHAVDVANTVQGYPAPFDRSINEIKVNLALGGRPGPLAPGAVGSTGALFEVDYLRIYRL